jgi:hypothetical protein
MVAPLAKSENPPLPPRRKAKKLLFAGLVSSKSLAKPDDLLDEHRTKKHELRIRLAAHGFSSFQKIVWLRQRFFALQAGKK